MGLLSKLGIHFDKHTLGNLAKNLSPAAGLIGGPLGIAAAGGLSALGDLGRGKNIGQALGGSLGNMALAGGVSAAKGKLPQLKSLFTGGSGAGAATPGAPGIANVAGSLPNSTIPTIGQSGMLQGGTFDQGRGLASKFGSKLGSVAHFAEKNPNAIGMGLNAAGNMASAGSENRLRNAQATRLDAQTQLENDEREAQRRRAQALAPFLQSLMGQAQNYGQGTVAPNPYTMRGNG